MKYHCTHSALTNLPQRRGLTHFSTATGLEHKVARAIEHFVATTASSEAKLSRVMGRVHDVQLQTQQGQARLEQRLSENSQRFLRDSIQYCVSWFVGPPSSKGKADLTHDGCFLSRTSSPLPPAKFRS